MTANDWVAELRDERTWMRRRAALALAKMPHHARGVRAALAETLGDRDGVTRRFAAQALETLAAQEASAQPLDLAG
jgi:HEAT repeat protein